MRWLVVCTAVLQKWDLQSRVLRAADLDAFAKARRHAEPVPSLPNLHETWDALDARFRESIRVADDDELNYDAFDELTRFAAAVSRCAPDFLHEVRFPDKYEAEITAVVYNATNEASDDLYTTDPDELRASARRMDSIASSLERLNDFPDAHSKEADKVANRLRARSERLEQEANESEPSDPDYDSESEHRSPAAETVIFDIGRLFSEL
jgi:hypothetical protein